MVVAGKMRRLFYQEHSIKNRLEQNYVKASKSAMGSQSMNSCWATGQRTIFTVKWTNLY